MFLFRDKEIPLNKELRVALQSIWSVGWHKSLVITSKLGFAYPFFINNLNNYNFALIFFMLKRLTLSETRLRRSVANNIKTLIEMDCYRGLRHKLFLPVRGQRTRTNAGTRRRLRDSKDKLLWF